MLGVYISRIREYNNKTLTYCIGPQLDNFVQVCPNLPRREEWTQQRRRGVIISQMPTKMGAQNKETTTHRYCVQSRFL
jgi:hypothetical protein